MPDRSWSAFIRLMKSNTAKAQKEAMSGIRRDNKIKKLAWAIESTAKALSSDTKRRTATDE